MRKPIDKEYLYNTLISFDEQVLNNEYVKKEESHTHDNKDVLDVITTEKIAVWDKSEQNVQSDWNEIDSTSDAYIKNKPTSLLANGGNSDTVNGHTVESNVPVDAKFTDTVYDDTDIKAEIAKKADVTAIPSKVSDLENDSRYQTRSDIDTILMNYSTEIDVYIGEQIANAEHLKREIVTVLPSDTEASDNILYMLKVESATGNDKYQEYMKINGTVQMVGDTSVDLTDYAKSTDIPTTVAQLTDSASYAKKTEIPTTLPANGGNADTVNNHTVESNVPADAVFTDTIYDDTEVKESIEELNSNLDELKYSEVAGSKNIFDGIIEDGYYDTNTGQKVNEVIWKRSSKLNPCKANTTYAISGIGNASLIILFFNNSSLISFVDLPTNTRTFTTLTNTTHYAFYTNATISNIQIEEGTTATPYEPYIPSVKMLSDKTTQIDDLNVLGWVVPEEMPIKNYIDSDGVFHQRVGRVDLGGLDWTDNGEHKIWYTPHISNSKVNSYNGYCKDFEIVEYLALGEQCIVIHHTDGHSYIKFRNEISDIKQALQDVYLYYELEEENLIKVDGNEAVTKIKQDLEALTNYRTEKTLIGKFCGLNHYRNVYTGVISPSSGTINIPHGIATSEQTAYATNFSAYGCKIFPEFDGRAYIVDLKDNVWFDLSSGSNDIALKYPDSENCEFNYTIIIEYAIKE